MRKGLEDQNLHLCVMDIQERDKYKLGNMIRTRGLKDIVSALFEWA